MKCGAKQNAPIMRSSRAHRLLLAAQLRPSTSSWEIKQIQARRQGASFKLKLEGFCLSFFYPKDKMTTMFNAPDGICQVSQTPKRRTESFRAASGVILPDICFLHHYNYNILKQTKLNTRIALVKQTLN